MRSGLIGEISPLPTYDRSVGQYRNEQGRFVPRATILRLVDEESSRLATRMKAHARLLTNGSIDLPEFQRRAAAEIKMSGIRMGIFASGGRSQTSTGAYGSIGLLLRSQYQYLANFAQDLQIGKLTKEQAIARAGMYGGSSRVIFHQVEKVTRNFEGFTLAKRVLDAGSNHCPECIQYQTGDRYVPIEDIVPIGARCSCFSRCRCLIVYLKR